MLKSLRNEGASLGGQKTARGGGEEGGQPNDRSLRRARDLYRTSEWSGSFRGHRREHDHMTSGLFNSKILTYRQVRIDPLTVSPKLAVTFESTASLAGQGLLVEKNCILTISLP